MRNIFVTRRAASAPGAPLTLGGAVVAGLVLTGSAFPAPAAMAQDHCGGEYVVERGDTLSGIAARCDSTVAGLVRANAQVSDPDVLLIGWRLTVPEALGHGAPGPEYGEPGEEEAAEGRGEKRTQAPAAPPAEGPELVRLEGRIAEGPECPVLRTADGQIYSLVGGMEFPAGAYVEVTGRTVAMSFCMRGTTVEVTSMHRIEAPEGQ